MLVDELIEKAFSMGYEYALEEQKEFGKLDLELSKKSFPEYAKFVGNDPAKMKKFLREKRAMILSGEHHNAHHGLDDLKALKKLNPKEAIQAVNQKITNKAIKLAKKSGKAIRLGGGFATID